MALPRGKVTGKKHAVLSVRTDEAYVKELDVRLHRAWELGRLAYEKVRELFRREDHWRRLLQTIRAERKKWLDELRKQDAEQKKMGMLIVKSITAKKGKNSEGVPYHEVAIASE